LGSYNLNWVHGHWSYGYYYTDANIGYTITPNTNWVVACGRNVAVGSGKLGTIITGVTTSTGKGGTGNRDLSIGTYSSGTHPETSDWQLSRLYVWDSRLSDDEFTRVSSKLNQYLATGSLCGLRECLSMCM